jgi:hypothetical protein
LSRTPASAGNRKTWTWAGWVKRSKLGEYVRLFNNTTSPANAAIQFMDTDKLRLFDTAISLDLQTTQVFRDPSSWYHIVVSLDTTQGTASNRAKLYVNGSAITAFSTSTYPSQNADGGINNNVAHSIGGSVAVSEYFNGYLADIYFIDGQALDPTSFTETDATTGQLIPKAYTGSYGTNGFHLEFADNSSNTATTLGKDTSGNGNNWTPNNLSVTAGAGNDSLVDVPTNGAQTDTGVGGEVRGNYATWNPLSKASAATLSNGNLDASYTGSSYPHLGSDSTICLPTSGKWYWEITVTTVGELWTGIRNVVDGKQSTYYRDGSGGFNNIRIEASSSTGSANAASYTSGDTIGVAVNCDGSTIAWYKNGSQIGTTYSLTNVANLVPFAGHASSSGSAAVVANFGQRPFAYTAPSGFKALNTANLPAPLVTKPNTVMDVALYTGNGSTQTISGLGFSPDFLWIKSRSTTYDHQLADVVRGVGNILHSNLTAAEGALNTITATTSNGFTVDATSYIGTNANGQTFAAWTWDAGSSTVTNTAGSITSSVRANATAGFSIVSWTGNATQGATVGHGLGIKPDLVIYKNRIDATDWPVLSEKLLGGTGYLYLNSTQQQFSNGNLSAATSTVLNLPSFNDLNGSGDAMIAYCFAPVVGYSSFGSYTGNGSSDGVFVYTGFRPRFVLFKRTDSSGQWTMYDTARDSSNVSKTPLAPNESTAESGFGSGYNLDILSNGFKWRDAGAVNNASGGTYIYAAFAESPFNYARAR